MTSTYIKPALGCAVLELVMHIGEPLLTCSVTAGPSDAAVSLTGEIDMSVADELSQVLTAVAEDHRAMPIKIDIAGVRFIDSSAIRVFMNASRACAQTGGSLRLTHLTGLPAQVLQISGVLQILTSETA